MVPKVLKAAAPRIKKCKSYAGEAPRRGVEWVCGVKPSKVVCCCVCRLKKIFEIMF
jgi:hypothetical protein